MPEHPFQFCRDPLLYSLWRSKVSEDLGLSVLLLPFARYTFLHFEHTQSALY